MPPDATTEGAQLVLVFGSVARFDQPGFADGLAAAFPGAVLAGCSTAGEIVGDGVLDESCTVTAIRFTRATIAVAEADIGSADESQPAGEALGRALAALPDLSGVLLFARGVAVNGSALIDGLVSCLPAGIPVSGGLAGDGGAFTRTLVLGPSGVSEGRAVAVGLRGAGLRFGLGSVGGWEPFGPARKVTRSVGNRLLELDGEPALNVYKRYLGDYARDLPASGLLFPFELLNGNHDSVGLIRTILGIDEAAGGLILAGTVEEGFYLRLMHASTDGLVDGAEQAGAIAAADHGAAGHPADGGAEPQSLALLVSCVGRKLVMGDRVEEEVQAVADRLGPGVVLTGFYSYGEIGPMRDLVDCRLHNQTMTVALLTER
ncbi:FIST N-terminal domain-containing protein [Azospirillum sp. TSO35-2]|uniref:FIST signal transduction protein n=1 Tax=Azospirillum sp. TSO35-2 TaxID=716796 RepID=UPI0020001C49|nr:FIST N-terminal domain-containing protein [Azospirillum sp. TSO35-2]